MFDTMTLTKIVGAFCGTLLVFLLGNFVAEEIYHSGGGHGEGEQAYVIETPDEGSAEEETEEVDFATVMASADAGAGERVFNKCRACHKLEKGANATGPYLYGVVGREIASVPDFNYSGSLAPQGDVWSPENLQHFLTDPQGWAPGTKMSFNGLPDVEDRANLIAFLDSVDE